MRGAQAEGKFRMGEMFTWVNNGGPLKMQRHIAARVQDADDLQHLTEIPMIDHVRSGSQLAIPFANINRCAPPRAARQRKAGIANFIGIAVCLIQPPILRSVVPDGIKIGNCGR